MTLQSALLDGWNLDFQDFPVECFESLVYALMISRFLQVYLFVFIFMEFIG